MVILWRVLCMVPGQKPPDKNPATISHPVCFTIKQDARFTYYPMTGKFCIHVKIFYTNVTASFSAILSENWFFLRMKKWLFCDFLIFFTFSYYFLNLGTIKSIFKPKTISMRDLYLPPVASEASGWRHLNANRIGGLLVGGLFVRWFMT